MFLNCKNGVPDSLQNHHTALQPMAVHMIHANTSAQPNPSFLPIKLERSKQEMQREQYEAQPPRKNATYEGKLTRCTLYNVNFNFCYAQRIGCCVALVPEKQATEINAQQYHRYLL